MSDTDLLFMPAVKAAAREQPHAHHGALCAGRKHRRTARTIADKLKDVLEVTVLVENKAGASGMIGSHVAARSPPDAPR